MIKNFAPQALALCLAVMATASVLASMDVLATRQHAREALSSSPSATQQVLMASRSVRS